MLMQRFIKLTTVAVCAAAAGTAARGPAEGGAVSPAAIEARLADLDVCLVIFDDARDVMTEYNPTRCRQPFPPCSTFKIPNSLIGLHTGVLTDGGTTFEWDGVTRDRVALNRDHTLATAMQHSVVWYYQEVARRIGSERMARQLAALAYGNQDMTAGLTTFWLGSSLKISAVEQIDFLRRLADGRLPVSDHATAVVKDITTQWTGEGYTYRAKTGSDKGAHQDLGWYVGWIERPGGNIFFAMNISGRKTFGTTARRLTEDILQEAGYLPAEARVSRPAAARP